ncbi:MAG: VOC family protein [Actinomycetota bacterium]
MSVKDHYTHGTPNWVDLATTDVEAAQAFYGALLGWTFTENPTDQGSPYVMATKGGRNVAGMMQMAPDMQAGGMPSMWNTYVAVDDVAAITAAAENAGGSVMVPPMQVMEHGHMSMIVDPTGAPVGLWQAGAHIGAELVNEPGAICWNELQTHDVPAAAAFFEQLLGWGAQTEAMEGIGSYTVFMLGEVGICGSLTPPIAEVPPHWSVVFAVEDADAAAARATELGGGVHAEPFDAMPGRITVLSDPTGAVFQAIQLHSTD